MDSNKLYFEQKDVQIIAQKLARENPKVCRNSNHFQSVLSSQVRRDLNQKLQPYNSTTGSALLPERIFEWIKVETMRHTTETVRTLNAHMSQKIDLLGIYPPQKFVAKSKNLSVISC